MVDALYSSEWQKITNMIFYSHSLIKVVSKLYNFQHLCSVVVSHSHLMFKLWNRILRTFCLVELGIETQMWANVDPTLLKLQKLPFLTFQVFCVQYVKALWLQRSFSNYPVLRAFFCYSCELKMLAVRH